MLTEERLRVIQKLVEERRSVTIPELVQELGISESTARRYLTILDEKGWISRVRGGAMANASARESRFQTTDDAIILRRARNSEEKKQIARYAASLIQANDFVYLDTGTTTELMIDYLAGVRATFVTNAVTHVKRLSELGYTTYILGGEFKPDTEAIVGEEAISALQKYNFTKGFWGTNGISLSGGFSTPDVREAMVKKISMERCAQCYVLGDPSKFSKLSRVKFKDFADATIITTEIPQGQQENYGDCENIVEVCDWMLTV